MIEAVKCESRTTNCGNPTRNPSRRCHLHQNESVSYGITPFKGDGLPLSLSGPSSDYYTTDRYKDFEDSLRFTAEQNGVTINSLERAAGVYEGMGEPSAAVEVQGNRASIERVAKDVGREFDQYAVRVIYKPGSAAHKAYTFNTGEFGPDDILAALKAAGVPGGRVVNGDLEIADFTDIGRHSLEVLSKYLGEPKIEACEVVRLITADA